MLGNPEVIQYSNLYDAVVGMLGAGAIADKDMHNKFPVLVSIIDLFLHQQMCHMCNTSVIRNYVIYVWCFGNYM